MEGFIKLLTAAVTLHKSCKHIFWRDTF